MKPRLTPLAFVLVLVVAGEPCAAGVDDLKAAKDAALQELVAALEQVAKWDNSSKLHGKRDETYELILELAPDHAKARKTLKFRRAEDGSWSQDEKYKRPRNWKPELFEKHAGKVRDAWLGYRDRMADVCSGATTAAGLSWAAGTAIGLFERFPGDEKLLVILKRTLLRHLHMLEKMEVPAGLAEVSGRLRKHFPDDPETRRALGERLLGDRWVLPATVRSVERRKQLTEAAAAALKAVTEIRKEDPGKDEAAVGLTWNGVFRTRHMRALGTTTKASLREIVRSCEAAGPFFHFVFGREPKRPKSRTFYVFPNRKDWLQFTERYPGLTPERREHARKAAGSGFGVDATHYAGLPVGSAAAERDLCVDVTFQQLLYDTFSRWYEDRQQWQEMPGWVRIGLSDYLTFRLIGTRILTTVGGEYDRPAKDVKGRSPKARTDWLRAARNILTRTKAPGTHLMLGKSLGAFGKDDAIVSFAFSSWLLEGRPESAAKILTALGRGRTTQQAVRSVLALKIEALHVELLRWLEETTS